MLYTVAVQGSTVAGAGPMSSFVMESYASVTSMTYTHETSTTPTPGERTHTFSGHTPSPPHARLGDQLAFWALICVCNCRFGVSLSWFFFSREAKLRAQCWARGRWSLWSSCCVDCCHCGCPDSSTHLHQNEQKARVIVWSMPFCCCLLRAFPSACSFLTVMFALQQSSGWRWLQEVNADCRKRRSWWWRRLTSWMAI